ncbi:hypothetical protein [Rhodococcus sp. ARC_M5]|uniref:hypothetical protein n=1 Tax=Rhodococcus sp. ARC_M5 TaxID=2928851 RepID=UPI001FB45390|nr:hypothetical protein [Rhodococcus sp. ARC_M5]MCJ0893313.1 hypothetical protein [Rhodococcus sp. ARC_M5]
MHVNVECAVHAVAPENPQFTALRLWTSVHGIAALNSTHAFEPIVSPPRSERRHRLR